jgi:HK97 gp10 family phage protein
MATEIKMEGLEGVLNTLEDAVSIDSVTASLNRACALVERAAKQKAPKGNGELRRSIASRTETDADGIKGIVFTPLLYAPYVEFGTGLFAENDNGRKEVPWHYKDDEGNWHTTSGMKPQPFLRPALEENREQILRILKGV